MEQIGIGEESAYTLAAGSSSGYEHFFACMAIVPTDVPEPDGLLVIGGRGFLGSGQQGLILFATVDAEIIRVIGGE
jgi:hypothetical protein